MYRTLVDRLNEPRRFVQILSGPRQVGKTTLALQALREIELPSHYASADEPALRDSIWIEQQWDRARQMAAHAPGPGGGVLVLDEVHKISDWSEHVKRLWDEDGRFGLEFKVVLLGSSPLLMQSGLSESMAGRFEMIPVPHWSFTEMKEAFGWDLERFVFFGGYPAAAELVGEIDRWARYIIDSLIETTLARDILQVVRVNKPALLRRLFQLGCAYSGQVLSYQKMIGQLQDAGNTTTLAHYLDLLAGAGMLTGLPKFSGKEVRRRASSPKFQVLNTALMTAPLGRSPEEVRRDGNFWGRLIESAVGAHLVNDSAGSLTKVFYWRKGNAEVDFVLEKGGRVTVLEVKSGRRRTSLPGMAAFHRAFSPERKILVGGQGVPVGEFLLTPVSHLV